jgi:hypothetical protein
MQAASSRSSQDSSLPEPPPQMHASSRMPRILDLSSAFTAPAASSAAGILPGALPQHSIQLRELQKGAGGAGTAGACNMLRQQSWHHNGNGSAIDGSCDPLPHPWATWRQRQELQWQLLLLEQTQQRQQVTAATAVLSGDCNPAQAAGSGGRLGLDLNLPPPACLQPPRLA